MTEERNPYSNSLVKYKSPQPQGIVKKKRLVSGRKGKKLPPVQRRQAKFTQTEDILNSILPPREWNDGQQTWIQYVSSTPATRSDVRNLQDRLDELLIQRKAQETGICPVREDLYAECFDEIIRQVTIKCAERGLLLLRIRNELKMTQKAYETLYESSVAFGMRKSLQAEHGKNELKNEVQRLEEDNRMLRNQVEELKLQKEAIEKREVENRKRDEKKHKQDVDFHKKKCQQLRMEIERILSLQNKK